MVEITNNEYKVQKIRFEVVVGQISDDLIFDMDFMSWHVVISWHSGHSGIVLKCITLLEKSPKSDSEL